MHRDEPTKNAQKDDRDWNLGAASQKYRLQDVIAEPHDDAPNQEHYGMVRGLGCERVKHRGYEDNRTHLNYGGDQKYDCPEACPRKSPDPKAEASQNRLDYSDTQDAVRDTTNRAGDKLLELSPAFIENPSEDPVCRPNAACASSQQKSCEQKGQKEFEQCATDSK